MDQQCCYHCQDEESLFFCACSQNIICENCIKFHQGSTCYILDRNLDITNPAIDPIFMSANYSSIEIKTLSNQDISEISTLTSYIDELIASVKIHKEVYLNYLDKHPENDKIIMKYPNLVQFNLNFEESEMQKIILNKSKQSFIAQHRDPQYFYALHNSFEQTKLIKVDLETFMSEEIIEIQNKTFTCSWILPVNNCVYLIEIYEPIVKNISVIKVDLKTKNIKEFILFDQILNGYSCVHYKTFIYIIGGRFIQKTKKIAQNTIYVLDTEIDQIVNQFELKEPRYNICAFIHNNKLYVTSENVVEKIEIFDLTSNSPKSEVKIIKLIAGLDCGIVSYGN
ncbi:hypothetical protein SteCoe_17312 [Stentor coeruleus]|uniref:Uncharacterized protein n=1 Tax=Stentor coeruleus TaxID=5963 RepID=A0A1R2BZ63_9CILI|nr:hypothetical protein SteCoe_17312 [Stentor coeruleus]